ncbi:microtubule-associated protein tau-like protein, partial [Dinothrombium tinctorium]
LPPIKAPVGLAKGPDLKNVKSRIGSFSNVKHKPAGGEKKVITQKLEWKAKSRIGSLENAKHKPGGGEVKVSTQKLEWKAGSKVGSLDNVKHKPGGGDVKIFDEKYARSSSELSSNKGDAVRSPSPASSTKSTSKITSTTPVLKAESNTNGELQQKMTELSLKDTNAIKMDEKAAMNSNANGITDKPAV